MPIQVPRGAWSSSTALRAWTSSRKEFDSSHVMLPIEDPFLSRWGLLIGRLRCLGQVPPELKSAGRPLNSPLPRSLATCRCWTQSVTNAHSLV